VDIVQSNPEAYLDSARAFGLLYVGQRRMEQYELVRRTRRCYDLQLWDRKVGAVRPGVALLDWRLGVLYGCLNEVNHCWRTGKKDEPRSMTLHWLMPDQGFPDLGRQVECLLVNRDAPGRSDLLGLLTDQQGRGRVVHETVSRLGDRPFRNRKPEETVRERCL
jgi:hypothetical protein